LVKFSIWVGVLNIMFWATHYESQIVHGSAQLVSSKEVMRVSLVAVSDNLESYLGAIFLPAIEVSAVCSS